MKKILTASAVTLCLLSACKDKKTMDNPFFSAWNTPYEIPDFGRIKPEHYMPAFEEGMRRQKAEIDSIVNNPEEPCFANTIEAYEYSGALLEQVSGVFFNLSECENSPEMEAIAEEVTPKLSAHADDIALDAALFRRVKTVYDSYFRADGTCDSAGLDAEQLRLLEETYKSFVRGGANVPASQQERFRQLNSQIASLTLRFAQNVLKATNDYRLVLDADQLDGLTSDQIAVAREVANADETTKDQYVVTLHMPSWEPFMMNSRRRDLREQAWTAYTSRCAGGRYDNTRIIDTLVNLRLERANILGYPTHADYIHADCIARTPDAVYRCLNQIWTPALQKAKAECAEYQKMLSADDPGAKLQPWDWRYYSERLRRQRYSLDDDEVRPYFSLDGVREGAFMVAHKLYGLTFRENQNLPSYNSEARSYEVLDSGRVIGVLYMDFFPRASKRSGAWMTEFRGQHVDRDGNNIIPVIQIVCNFTKPAGGKPSLLSFDESETLFHEFGHALHGLLSRCRYGSLAGTNVPRDFVELPSQIMENWCRNPQVMRDYAHHYQTGESIPDSLIAKIAAAQTYGQGFINTELLAASLLDMDYHTLSAPQRIDPLVFEKTALDRIGLIPEIVSRYKSPYFQHIFTTGYDAGYYSYTWTAILDADAFQAFQESGDLYNPALARKFRTILESGNTRDLMQLYRDFRGHDPDVKPLLRNRGLL
ncbi:MAG: peptidyl-dipeptidase Dcp [bacterium P3]|nr:MAG: peptidyl-dipeptidase Dcp [bacterium P3]KWW42318.1 MAG: peptidyl-dipeptidase Dcp [bacterium F083]